MRNWHRLKNIVPLLLAISMSADSSAQPRMDFPSFAGPAYMAGPQPAYSATATQGMPQSFQSNPMISPFDQAFEQHFNSDGLWFKRALGGFGPGASLNDFYFNIDYTRTKTRQLDGLFGDATATTYLQQSIIDGDPGFPDNAFLSQYSEQNTMIVPAFWRNGIRLSGGMENRTGWGFSWNANYNGINSAAFDARAILEATRRNLLNVTHFSDAVFLEATGGVVNPNLPTNLRQINERKILETQILNARLFDAANAETFEFAGGTDDILDRNLYPYGSIPMHNGIDLDGFPQLFDLDFVLEQTIETYGTGAHVSFSAVYEDDSVQVRPILGGRFFRIRESMNFRGVNSGLDYLPDLPDGVDDDDDFVIDNVEENGTLSFVDRTPNIEEEILIRSFVSSEVRSTMGGPEIGFEYSVGERGSLSLNGSTRVGVLFNNERATLAGDNIGDTLRTDLVDGLSELTDMFDTTTADGQLTQNAFADSMSTTHVSPMFEQSFRAEVPLFERIPVLRDMPQLEHATFRAGWTFTWIGEVADPGQQITWLSRPRDGVFPTLKVSRNDFYQHTLDLGIHWEF
ncbi:MAG: hypothetical protein GY758_25965 [Fuerstiella sp.]|nr:hypothetical protein [Fuerstiella sp.]MCP4510295.1 hypothetical protein [Fuerstiella sp.]